LFLKLVKKGEKRKRGREGGKGGRGGLTCIGEQVASGGPQVQKNSANEGVETSAVDRGGREGGRGGGREGGRGDGRVVEEAEGDAEGALSDGLQGQGSHRVVNINFSAGLEGEVSVKRHHVHYVYQCHPRRNACGFTVKSLDNESHTTTQRQTGGIKEEGNEGKEGGVTCFAISRLVLRPRRTSGPPSPTCGRQARTGGGYGNALLRWKK